jgi:hypothetical protein
MQPQHASFQCENLDLVTILFYARRNFFSLSPLSAKLEHSCQAREVKEPLNLWLREFLRSEREDGGWWLLHRFLKGTN